MVHLLVGLARSKDVLKQQLMVDLSLWQQGLVLTRLLRCSTMLRMLGVPMKGPSIMFGDILVITNSSAIPDATLEKRHNALSYHSIREAIASKLLNLHNTDCKGSPANELTKYFDSKI